MKERVIYFLIYDGFELLDLSGPAGVFSTASFLTHSSCYRCRYISVQGGLIVSGCGMQIMTEAADIERITDLDTVLVMGAYSEALECAAQDQMLLSLLVEVETKAERTGSICSGAFILAAAGLLARRLAATHWFAVDQLACMFPEVSVLPDAMYHSEGNIWTSAGVTTGIDMALAMVEQDMGSQVMDRVARQLVVYSHRPGHQSQFSHLLNAQMASNRQFSEVVEWVQDNLRRSIKVEDLANVAGMSERTFYRKFTDAIGMTPSKYIENSRLEYAKTLIASGMAINQVAISSGFKSQAGFRSAFEGKYGIPPSHYRRMNCR